MSPLSYRPQRLPGNPIIRPGAPALYLTYEDDIEQDPLVAYRRVCLYLGLEPETPAVTVNGTTPQLLPAIVTTLATVRRVLSGTRYEWMAE